MNESGDLGRPGAGAAPRAAGSRGRHPRRDRPAVRRGPHASSAAESPATTASRACKRGPRQRRLLARARGRRATRFDRPGGRLGLRAVALRASPTRRARADRARRGRDRAPGRCESRTDEAGGCVSRHHLRGGRGRRRAAAARPAGRPQRDQHADARGAARASGGGTGRRAACGCSWSPRPTTWDCRPAPTCVSSWTRRAEVRRMELFARLYDELTGFAKPTVAACHGACVGGGAEVAVACDLRVGGSNLRMRFPGAALGVPVGPARLATLCGLSVAKYLLLTARRSTPTWRCGGASCTRSRPPAATEERGGRSSPRRWPPIRPRRSARVKRMLHDWDGVEERSRAEGEGQVEWQRSGHRAALPGLISPARLPPARRAGRRRHRCRDHG